MVGPKIFSKKNLVKNNCWSKNKFLGQKYLLVKKKFGQYQLIMKKFVEK